LEEPEPYPVDFQAFIVAKGRPPILLTVFDEDKVKEGDDEDNVIEEGARGLKAHAEAGAGDETTHTAGRAETVDDLRRYTVDMARFLSSALLNYCCCNFFIVPCVIAKQRFSTEELDKEVRRGVDDCRVFLKDDVSLELDSTSYTKVVRATRVVAGVAWAPPSLLQSSSVPETQTSSTGQVRFKDRRCHAPEGGCALTLPLAPTLLN
jgi:hypothetical protein